MSPYRNRLYQREEWDGIRVVRVWTILSANRGVFWRSLDFLSFAVSGFLAGLREPCDVIVATSPQLLTGLAGSWLARAKGRPWVLEIRDLWPDSIVSVGVMDENLFIRALRRLEQRLYRSAARVVAVSSGIRDRLAARGVPREKLGVAPNGVELERFECRPPSAQARNSVPLSGQFLAGYIGTHGMAQGLETLLDAAARLRGSDVHFLFAGDGARREALIQKARQLQLRNVSFIGLVPANVAADYLRLCDVVLIPLKRTDQIEITLPGKLFEAAAAGKPLIVSAEGASAELVESYGAGLVSPPEDSEALAAALMRLREDSGLRQRLSNGALALARDFDRTRFAREMLHEVELAMNS